MPGYNILHFMIATIFELYKLIVFNISVLSICLNYLRFASESLKTTSIFVNIHEWFIDDVEKYSS